jgi:hypothetical protein
MIKRFILSFVLVFIANVANAFSYVLELSENEVQEKVEQKMPFEKKKYFITVAISNPQVSLKNGNDKIGILSNIAVKLPGGLTGNGKALIEGGIKYTPKDGEFYFTDPKVKQLKIENLPEKFETKVVKVVDIATKKVLEKTPVYKFKDDNLKHKLAKATLKSVNIKNGKLALELGI